MCGNVPFCVLFVVLIASTLSSSLEGNAHSTPPPSAYRFEHRGAARQMYGSASLRPPGQYPPPPRNPQGKLRHRQPPLYPIFPLAVPAQDFERIPDGYPIFVPDNPFFMEDHAKTKARNGARINGVRGGGYHFDYANRRIGGEFDRVYDTIPGYKRSSMRNPIDEESPRGEEEEEYDHPCGGECANDEFLCSTSCTCIKENMRCDGDVDCEGDEDELDCGEGEEARNLKCEESDRHVRCPRSGKCISKEWLCDGDDDCGDYSDETHCGSHANCTEDQFECANGLCIPITWLCDNDNDCKDLSDEQNCTKIGCTNEEFACTDGQCISLSWKCDKEPDCIDGSDEERCDIEPTSCNEDEFQCAYKKCIKIEFRCDGDDDCGDWSDEDDCPKTPGNCVSGEFKCNNGKCIPERWRCDKQHDCENNEDEANCNASNSRTCSPEEFTCDSGACILNKWVCDGVPDCTSGEDEKKCNVTCDSSKFGCLAPDTNDTYIQFCINRKYVCDGQKDCPTGNDEFECPIKRQCDTNSICSQLCVTYPEKRQGCSCHPGYKLAPDGINCEDIDECLYETDPVCSQTCNNTIGSFTCGCMTGYILRPDLRTCKALGAPPTLLFANRMDIRQVSLQVSISNTKYTAILKGLHNAIALDYHYEKGLIFWSDVSMDVIRKAYINGTGAGDVIKWGLESPGGVALDWVHDLLYWTDSGTRRIEVSTLDGKYRAIVIAADLEKPRAIAVHPGKALLFWTDWGPSPKIERAEMDGGDRVSVITESVFWPNGLTLDYTTDKIYWADAKHNVIESADFDGSERRKIVSKGLPHPFALTLFEDAIYWTDWHTKSISTANKATGAGLHIIHYNLHFPMDIHSYHPQRQPKFKNHCGPNNGGCQHMCLPTKDLYKCVCRMGQSLKPDGRSCKKPDKLLIFARKKDLRIKHLDSDAVHQHEMVIPVDGIKSAVALAWDSKTDMIFWTDVEKDTINSAHWNGSDQKVLIRTNIVSPAGLALDWITDKLYWTDAGTSRIEVSNTDGSMRGLLVWANLDKPRDIVVDPIGGYMYWSDWGKIPKIERAAMDGTMRQVIVSSNLTWPNGLAIDRSTEKLYWADGGTKAIECSNFDGTNRRILIGGSGLPHPFGLDIYGDLIYWTDWSTSNIESANKHTGANRVVLGSGISGLMDVRVFHRNRKTIRTFCTNNNGGCSHLCLLKPKGHTCACPTGIKLGEDGKTCADAPRNSLLLAHRMDIRQISLDVAYTVDVVLPFPPMKNVISVDVDKKTGEIYWTDNAEDIIQKGTPDGKTIDVVLVHELQMVDGIAIDSADRKIYWTDGERNSIEVAELDGSNRKLLIWKDLDTPRAITLHHHHGVMFWSDWGTHAKIERADMDGNNRITLINNNVEWPNGLAIDRPAERLYWNDGKLKTIESSDLNGKNRKIIIRNALHPYGLVVLGNHIYWTDWQTQALHRADKLNGSEVTIIRGKLEGLMDVRAAESDNVEENACGSDNGGCSHLCLRNPSSFTCACPTGVKLNKDKKSCEHQPAIYLLFATRAALARIALDTEETWDYTLPIPDVHNAVDVDFHWKKQLIFYTDAEKETVDLVNMKNLSETRTIVATNSSTPNGVAVDWISDLIYWTDTTRKTVETGKIDGSCRKVVVTGGLEEPRSVAVFPRKGYLYWSDWGEHAKIERSFMDGSGRKTIIDTKLAFPNGLVVDYAERRLYWTDAKRDMIETSDLHGRSRVQLVHSESKATATHPFGLTQLGEYIYWTDWYKKTIIRADKATGKSTVVVKANLDGAMGITAVSANRQQGWNPCAEHNGGCTHLCFFRLHNYTCGCPDEPDEHTCNTEPKEWLPINHPDNDYEDEDEEEKEYFGPNRSNTEILPEHSSSYLYRYLLISIILIILVSIAFVGTTFWVVVVRNRKKKYIYSNGRSVRTFSNPNYYTSNNDSGTSTSLNTIDKKPFTWKRIKYDKSQERVYEEKVGGGSPEVASLIPNVLTPGSSNFEAVTPEVGQSPSITPLHRIDAIQPMI